MSMSEEDLPHFERIMEQETLDIYNYIIGTDELTPELDNPVMHSIRAYAQANPVGKASIEEYEKDKEGHVQLVVVVIINTTNLFVFFIFASSAGASDLGSKSPAACRMPRE